MAFTRRQSRRKPRRGTDWHNAELNTSAFSVAANVQSNTALWTPTLNDDNATVVRIVGWIHVAPQVPVDVTGFRTDTLNMGIQVVNRVLNSAGVARDPALADDREGSEWMWMGQAFHVSHTTTSAEFPPSTNLWLSQDSKYNPQIDIRVKRKIDKSQDEIVLSIRSLNLDWSISSNLRMLIMRP